MLHITVRIADVAMIRFAGFVKSVDVIVFGGQRLVIVCQQ